jgi:hypothetical protein
MLKPGNGKTHRAYMWSYCTASSNATRAVMFDFSETRSVNAQVTQVDLTVPW